MNETTTTENDGGETVSAGTSDERRTCPECDGPIVAAATRGERTCEDCGLVVDADAIDRGPEWRAFTETEADERRRVGAPVTERMHDKGLSTTISWQDEDGYGNQLSPQKRKRIRRLRTWDERFRTKDAHERNLRQAFGEIDRMASALGLPEPCRETASVLYRRAVEAELLPGRSIESMATASLYAAARQHGTPRTFMSFEAVSRVDQLPIQRAYRYLARELGLGIAPPDPLEYVGQFASDLGVSDEAERLAREILETGKSAGVHTGKRPAGLAGASIYAAARLTNERLTQATVCESTDVSEVTIRDRYQELLEAYGEGDV